MQIRILVRSSVLLLLLATGCAQSRGPSNETPREHDAPDGGGASGGPCGDGDRVTSCTALPDGGGGPADHDGGLAPNGDGGGAAADGGARSDGGGGGGDGGRGPGADGGGPGTDGGGRGTDDGGAHPDGGGPNPPPVPPAPPRCNGAPLDDAAILDLRLAFATELDAYAARLADLAPQVPFLDAAGVGPDDATAALQTCAAVTLRPDSLSIAATIAERLEAAILGGNLALAQRSTAALAGRVELGDVVATAIVDALALANRVVAPLLPLGVTARAAQLVALLGGVHTGDASIDAALHAALDAALAARTASADGAWGATSGGAVDPEVAALLTALVRYDEQIGDPRIVPALSAAVHAVAGAAWDAQHAVFRGAPGGASDNGVFLAAWAWVYRGTREGALRDQALAMMRSLVAQPDPARFGRRFCGLRYLGLLR